MTEDIKNKLKLLVDANPIASDIADCIIELEKENSELKETLKCTQDSWFDYTQKYAALVKENADYQERLEFYKAVTDVVDKKTYNEAVNELAILKAKYKKISKMFEMAMKDALSQSHYAECNGSVYGLNCKTIEEYRAKLEERIESGDI